MIDEKLDTGSHDLAFVGYDNVLIDGAEQVLQSVKMRLLTVFGEVFSDSTLGNIDLTGMQGSTGVKQLVDAYNMATIKDTPEVRSLDFYESTLNSDRVLSVTFRASSIYGPIAVNNFEVTI